MFATLAASIVLFVSDRVRPDVVALLALLVLLLGGVLTVAEGLAGFADPIVLMIAGLFVVGAALSATGAADWLAVRLGAFAGTGEARLIVAVMLTTALLSAFMSSTGTVAVLLPAVGTLATRAGVSPARLFMPMAIASLLGGMLTLIGTPPNIVVADHLRSRGHEPFRFFTFTPPGLVLLALGVGFMASVGRRLLPDGTTRRAGDAAPLSGAVMRNVVHEYGLTGRLARLVAARGSRAIGRTLAELNLRADFAVTVVGITRRTPQGPVAVPVLPTVPLEVDDVLLVLGDAAATERAAAAWSLGPTAEVETLDLPGDESIAEIVLPRRSHLVGETLREARFRDRYRATVLAVRSAGEQPHDDPTGAALRDRPLRTGDMLLLKGRIRHLKALIGERRDFVMVTEPRAPEEVSIRGFHAVAALGVTFGMLLLMTFGLVPNVVAVLLAAVAVVVLGCLDTTRAYQQVNWESVVLIAAILPMATALEKTGGMQVVVDALVSGLGDHGPWILLAALFVLTSAFSQVISNTATTVLVAPIAYEVATGLGLSPRTFLMTVAIAASTAFATPIASPVNTLVLGPGGYRFLDYVKVGVSLQLLVLAATLLVVPWMFPLTP